MCKTLQNGDILNLYVHIQKKEFSAAFNKVGGTSGNSVSKYIGDDEVVSEATLNEVGATMNNTSNITSSSNLVAQILLIH